MVEVAQNERGVLFRRFANGIDTSRVYLPGKYKIKPFDRFIKYNIDPRTEDNYFEAKTSVGKKLTLHIRYSFKILPEKIALMEYYIGDNYSEIVVAPHIQTSIDKYISELTRITFDSRSQNLMQENLHSIAKAKIRERYVDLYDFKILKLTVE